MTTATATTAAYCPPFTPMAEVLSEGTVGDCAIERFEVTREEARYQSVMAVFSFTMRGSRGLEPGAYARMTRNGRLWMSDTPDERRDMLGVVRAVQRYGTNRRVLVGGLGMGTLLVPLLRTPHVERVVVVEIDPDVVRLVEPQIRAHVGKADAVKLEVVRDDVFEYQTKEVFDVIWFDIWPDICADNWEGMKRLHRRYARRLRRETGWELMDSWKRDWCRSQNTGRSWRSGW
jgi:hypothetical protein